ncbi:hypothetical protein [Litoribacillus peritrichatus]|uniref:VWA domain-containing protein n=1 Tax=Litoribacillus peritrichatus TaxID=718191 RepID=A0ABP7MEA4_9GAMM
MQRSEPNLAHWEQAWQKALSLWSKYTKLRPPVLCETQIEAAKEGLTGSFAMIRLSDQTVVIDLVAITQFKLQDYAVEILAHEIGHHILSPASVSDHARMIARIYANLPTLEEHAGMVANLYTDLLINNHLKRQCDLKMDDIYRRINASTFQNSSSAQNTENVQNHPSSRIWQLYMRIYEHLWQLKRGSLGAAFYENSVESTNNEREDILEGDAWLGARIIKVYASDALKGASRFASLLLPYLAEEREMSEQIAKLMDTRHAATGQFPSGLINSDSEENDTVHPSNDPSLVGEQLSNTSGQKNQGEPLSVSPENTSSAGQYRDPFHYGQILKSAGLTLSDHDIAIRYYRERAMPLLVSFPSKSQPVKAELIPEGTTLWEPGEPMEDIDWFGTLSSSSTVIPGVTTVKREWGYAEENEPDIEPCDLDLYVDCSGSMPNPQQEISYTALAGTILCLSALRAGASVQVTLWSGTNQFKTTEGFVKNEHQILNVLTDYFGGGTAFPIHILRKTHIEQQRLRDTHIVILSDDGVTTMFDQDENDVSGWNIAEQALQNANGGGTMVLNLNWDYPAVTPDNWMKKDHDLLVRAEQDQQWSVYPVSSWEAMVQFAKHFSQRHYEVSNS